MLRILVGLAAAVALAGCGNDDELPGRATDGATEAGPSAGSDLSADLVASMTSEDLCGLFTLEEVSGYTGEPVRPGRPALLGNLPNALECHWDPTGEGFRGETLSLIVIPTRDWEEAAAHLADWAPGILTGDETLPAPSIADSATYTCWDDSLCTLMATAGELSIYLSDVERPAAGGAHSHKAAMVNDLVERLENLR